MFLEKVLVLGVVALERIAVKDCYVSNSLIAHYPSRREICPFVLASLYLPRCVFLFVSWMIAGRGGCYDCFC